MDALFWTTVTSPVATYEDDDFNGTTTEPSIVRSTGTSAHPAGGGDGLEPRLDLTLIQRFASNRRVNDAAFFGLIGAYCLLIVIGTVGNSLVVYVVARQPAMRTARNVFVVNLAISDLLLCLITMPLTVGAQPSALNRRRQFCEISSVYLGRWQIKQANRTGML